MDGTLPKFFSDEVFKKSNCYPVALRFSYRQ